MKDFCSEFGLTPAARTRIQVNTEETDTDDPMLEILKGVE
jgi:phage terminase small subunit